MLVGVIGRAHGVRGEVAVEPRTDEPELRYAPGAVLRVEDSTRTFTVVSARDHSGRLLVRFAELADRTAAEAARGTRLVADLPADARPDEPEEFYDRQLIGLAVQTADGTAVGTVAAVLHLPAQDVLEIDTPAGPRLVPFVADLVPEVDLAAGRLVVAPLPGLLDETAADEA